MKTQKNIAALSNSSVESIVYRELYSDNDFKQCLDLQQSVFKIPDSHLISPLFLKLFSRHEPPTGISVGVFSESVSTSEMIGVMIGTATFIEKSLYTILLGIKPEYKNKVYGYKLMQKFKEIAISRNIECTYGVFEPLETNLARLYIGMEGFTGIKYIEEPSDVNNFPSDKLLIKWDFSGTNSNIMQEGKNESDFPIATSNNLPENNKILIEIPENFLNLKTENIKKAIELRNSTRKIFRTYLNERKYIINNCITIKTDNKRKSYYLLEKK